MSDYFARIQKEGSPLIDGNTVTFVWYGASAPDLVSDLHGWEDTPVPLTQVDENIWIHTISLPRNGYLEYAFWDAALNKRFPDPYNSRRVPNGFGKYNHYFYMPDAHPHPLTTRQPGIPTGTVSRHDLLTHELAIGSKRRIYLYQPPVPYPVPLLVVYDGNDYFKRGRLTQVVDNLIHQQRIQPIALAMLTNGGLARPLEYACNEMTLGFVSEIVLPLAYEHLNLVNLADQPGAFGILGASMGGLMALYTALRLPEIFGHVISQSGAFAIDEHEFVIFNLVKYVPIPTLKAWLDVGLFEFLLDPNRRMHQLLLERGCNHGYEEYPGGHNYTTWRNHLWMGLEYIFGK
jgi:enterochelin esterase-like enzyme